MNAVARPSASLYCWWWCCCCCCYCCSCFLGLVYNFLFFILSRMYTGINIHRLAHLLLSKVLFTGHLPSPLSVLTLFVRDRHCLGMSCHVMAAILSRMHMFFHYYQHCKIRDILYTSLHPANCSQPFQVQL